MPSTFPLRLPPEVRQRAIELAEEEGVSLNQFIALATVEKVARLDAIEEHTTNGSANGHQPPRGHLKKERN